jgi:hypothetical protein
MTGCGETGDGMRTLICSIEGLDRWLQYSATELRLKIANIEIEVQKEHVLEQITSFLEAMPSFLTGIQPLEHAYDVHYTPTVAIVSMLHSYVPQPKLSSNFMISLNSTMADHSGSRRSVHFSPSVVSLQISESPTALTGMLHLLLHRMLACLFCIRQSSMGVRIRLEDLSYGMLLLSAYRSC